MENDELSQKLQETQNTTTEALSINLDDIETVESSAGFDATAFEGQRVRIAKVEVKEVIDKYPNGEFKADSTQLKQIVEITTAPLLEAKKDSETGNTTFGPNPFTFKQDDGSTKPLVITARFNLTFKDDRWVISKNSKANLWAFMRKMGVEKLSGLKGKVVTITTTPSKQPDDDKRYLAIVTK